MEFEDTVIELKKGDVLYLGSDGILDQNNEERNRFGSAKYNDLLAEIASLSMDVQKEKINSSLANHQATAKQRDDITVLGIKI